MRSARLQLFFLQYGSLLSLRFFPLHPGRLLHAFFVVVTGHSEGKVLLERGEKQEARGTKCQRNMYVLSIEGGGWSKGVQIHSTISLHS